MHTPTVLTHHEYKQACNDAEASLHNGFKGALAGVALQSVIQFDPEQSPPQDLDRYRLVPLVATSLLSRTIQEAGRAIQMPDDLGCNYKQQGGLPHLDTGRAIGFTYNNAVVAVAAGGVAGTDLTVKQLQATILSGLTSRQRRDTTGLYSGILWRDTLVQAWCEVGSKLGFESLTVQGAANNRWKEIRGGQTYDSDPMPTRTDLYDEVAARLGFTPSSDGNWHKSLDSQ